MSEENSIQLDEDWYDKFKANMAEHRKQHDIDKKTNEHEELLNFCNENLNYDLDAEMRSARNCMHGLQLQCAMSDISTYDTSDATIEDLKKLKKDIEQEKELQEKERELREQEREQEREEESKNSCIIS